jgi:hypothetical protein
MNHRAAYFASIIVILLAAAPAALADPFDGMDMRANRGTGPGSVDITWTGGQPTFRVYRSTDRQTVLDPANQIATTDIRSFSDSPPSGSILYYEIKSPCVYSPPEICNGLDDDCNGTIDGPGSEVNCQLPHAAAVCAAGACAIASCTPSFGDCDLSPADGCESNLSLDAHHCGSCSLDCGAGQGPCVHVACANFSCLPPVDTSRCLAPDGVSGAGACAAAAAGCIGTLDSDGDGLNDTWEDSGWIDYNCDGILDSNDVALPDANKAVRDVYVRIAWMEASTHLYPVPDPSAPGCPTVSFSEPPSGHKPLQDSIDLVVRAFAGAHLTPAAQPCGKPGDLPCGPVSTCVDFACLPLCTTDSQCAAWCNADCQGTGGAHCVPAGTGANKVCRKWRLHVDPLSATGVPHHDITTYGTVSPTCANTTGGGSMTPDDQVNIFDDKTPANFDPKELPFKHWVLFAHDNTCYGTSSPGCGDVSCPGVSGAAPKNQTSGMAEVNGNDSMVTLSIGQFVTAGPSARALMEAGTLMHELGHNLGLNHNGPGPSADEPQKVNYLSVMNYRYQTTGIPVTSTVGSNVPSGSRPDFGHTQFGQALNEGNLSEPGGVGPPPPPEPNTKALIRYSHPPTPPCPCPIDPCTGLPLPKCDAYGAISGPVGPPPIDWNCDGTISPLGVAADINGNGIAGEIQDPAGTEDWMNLFYGYQCQTSYVDGATGPVKQGAPGGP